MTRIKKRQRKKNLKKMGFWLSKTQAQRFINHVVDNSLMLAQATYHCLVCGSKWTESPAEEGGCPNCCRVVCEGLGVPAEVLEGDSADTNREASRAQFEQFRKETGREDRDV